MASSCFLTIGIQATINCATPIIKMPNATATPFQLTGGQKCSKPMAQYSCLLLDSVSLAAPSLRLNQIQKNKVGLAVIIAKVLDIIKVFVSATIGFLLLLTMANPMKA